ncbi:hypothetical protein Tco_0946036 [Tanacetum coccineum]
MCLTVELIDIDHLLSDTVQIFILEFVWRHTIGVATQDRVSYLRGDSVEAQDIQLLENLWRRGTASVELRIGDSKGRRDISENRVCNVLIGESAEFLRYCLATERQRGLVSQDGRDVMYAETGRMAVSTTMFCSGERMHGVGVGSIEEQWRVDTRMEGRCVRRWCGIVVGGGIGGLIYIGGEGLEDVVRGRRRESGAQWGVAHGDGEAYNGGGVGHTLLWKERRISMRSWGTTGLLVLLIGIWLSQ